MLPMSLTKNSSESVSRARSAAPLQQHRHQQSPHSRVVQQATGRRIFTSGDFDDLAAAAKQWHSEPPPVVAAVAYQPLAGVPTYSGCVKSIPCAVRLRKVDSDSWDRLSQTLSLPLSPEEANLNSSMNSSGDSNWWWRIEPLPGCRPLSSVSNASSSLSTAALSPPLSAFGVGIDDDSAIGLSESATAALDEKIERLVRARAALPSALSELAPYAGAAKTIPTALPPSLASLHSQSPQHKQQQQQSTSSTLMSMPMHLLDGVEEVEEVDDSDEMMKAASASTAADVDDDPFAKLKPKVNDGCPPGIALAAYPQPIGYAADVAGVRLLPVRLPTPDESRRRRLLAERAALEAVAAADAAKASDAKRPRELVPYAGWTLLEVEEAKADAEADADIDDNVEDDDGVAPRAHPEPERYQPLTQLTPYAGGEKILPGIAYSPFLVRRQQRQPRRQRRRRLSIVERPLGDCKIDEADLDQRIYMLLPDILFDELKDLLPTLITVTSADGRAPLPPTLSSNSSTSSIPMSTLARHRSARPPLCDTVRQNSLEMALLRIGDLAFACDLRCPHAGGPMNFGQLVSDYNGDCLLRCPWHGYTFNLFADGEIHSPSSRRDLRLRMYPVRRDRLGRLYIGFAELNKLWFSRAAPDDLF